MYIKGNRHTSSLLLCVCLILTIVITLKRRKKTIEHINLTANYRTCIAFQSITGSSLFAGAIPQYSRFKKNHNGLAEPLGPAITLSKYLKTYQLTRSYTHTHTHTHTHTPHTHTHSRTPSLRNRRTCAPSISQACTHTDTDTQTHTQYA